MWLLSKKMFLLVSYLIRCSDWFLMSEERGSSLKETSVMICPGNNYLVALSFNEKCPWGAPVAKTYLLGIHWNFLIYFPVTCNNQKSQVQLSTTQQQCTYLWVRKYEATSRASLVTLVVGVLGDIFPTNKSLLDFSLPQSALKRRLQQGGFRLW